MRTTLDDRNPINNLQKELLFRGFAPSTAKLYAYYTKKCLDQIQKSPRDINNHDLVSYLSSITSAREKSLAISSIKFYFNHILNRNFNLIPHPKQHKTTKNDKNWLILAKNILNPKHLTIIALKYGAKMKTKDIILLEKDDFLAKSSEIISNFGSKNEKRYLLDDSISKILNNWLILAKNIQNPYIFPGLGNRNHLSMRGIQKILSPIKNQKTA